MKPPKSKEGAQRQFDAIVRSYRRDFAGGGSFGFDWPTFRLNSPERYEQVMRLQALWPALPSRRGPKRAEERFTKRS